MISSNVNRWFSKGMVVSNTYSISMLLIIIFNAPHVVGVMGTWMLYLLFVVLNARTSVRIEEAISGKLVMVDGVWEYQKEAYHG